MISLLTDIPNALVVFAPTRPIAYETATVFFNSTAFSAGALKIVIADNAKLSITKVFAGFINGK